MLFKYLFAHSLLLIIGLAFFVRVYRLNQVPASLYWEEVALGYDAYSIAKTGRDHHGESWPLVAFRSFGDYKPSLYFYAAVPTVSLFGLNAWGVRLPAALAGVSTVVAVFYLGKWLVTGSEQSPRHRWLPHIAATWTALSPWGIQFSRGGWEVSLATCLVSWGMVAGLWTAGRERPARREWLLRIVAVVLLAMSAYTYHATRLLAPGLVVLLAGIWWWPHRPKTWRQLTNPKKLWPSAPLVGVILCFAVLVLPIGFAMSSPAVRQRFAETSLLADGQAVVSSNAAREWAGNTWWSRLVFHRYLFMAEQLITNGLTHLNPSFLFLRGDTNQRHSTGVVGILFPGDVFFVIAGAVVAWRMRWERGFPGRWALLWGWLFLGLVPAALTKAAPHALRILPVMPVVMLLVAEGVLVVVADKQRYLQQIGKRVRWLPDLSRIVVVGVAMLLLGQFILFWRYYQHVYPVVAAAAWQGGAAEMVHAVAQDAPELAAKNSPIFITREQGRPAMYYWFYAQTPPQAVQAAEQVAKQDQGEFLEFQNIHFINSVNEAGVGLVASSPAGMSQLRAEGAQLRPRQTIMDAAGTVVWEVYEVLARPGATTPPVARQDKSSESSQ